MQKGARYSAEFKEKVAKEAIKGEETLAQLASCFSVHSTQISAWKQQVLDGLTDIFTGRATPLKNPQKGSQRVARQNRSVDRGT